jgi:hypothetical protein
MIRRDRIDIDPAHPPRKRGSRAKEKEDIDSRVRGNEQKGVLARRAVGLERIAPADIGESRLYRLGEDLVVLRHSEDRYGQPRRGRDVVADVVRGQKVEIAVAFQISGSDVKRLSDGFISQSPL